jgi:hypothetical protein
MIADFHSTAPKKKQEKMALGDFLANQCTLHSHPTSRSQKNTATAAAGMQDHRTAAGSDEHTMASMEYADTNG